MNTQAAPRTCFVVAPIGEEGSEIRKRSDKVLKIIDRAVAPLGYKPIRADQLAAPGLINRQVIRYLIDAPLVVADLSGANPNVYYELALRHAFGKPVITLINKGEALPFDVRDIRTIPIDVTDAYKSEEDISQSAKEVDAPGFEFETPVTGARRDA